jgi:hypothetical protein
MEANQQLSQLGLAFFGLTLNSVKEYRSQFLTQIHEICFYGQGGYSWPVIYNMPIWLRRFTYQKIKDHYDRQGKEAEKAKNQNSNQKEVIGTDGRIKAPEFLKKANYK